MVNASVGVSAGPLRVSQGLPGCGAVIALVPGVAILVAVSTVWGWFIPGNSTITENGTYYTYATGGDAENTKIKFGTWETTTATPGCSWETYRWNGDEHVSVAKGHSAVGSTHVTAYIEFHTNFDTAGCGTWVKK